MRFLKAYKPDLMVSDDGSRGAICHVHFDGKQLVATDGVMAVRVPAEMEEGDIPGTIPLHVFKSAVKWTGKEHDEVSLLMTEKQWRIGETQGDFFLDNTAAIPRTAEPEKKFPIDGAMSVFEGARHHNAIRLSLNAELLALFQKAFGSTGVTLEFTTAEGRHAIRILPVDGPQAEKCEGVLMALSPK